MEFVLKDNESQNIDIFIEKKRLHVQVFGNK